jgi:multidrug efflux pump subunit AcrA (membrane-fusion protein)
VVVSDPVAADRPLVVSEPVKQVDGGYTKAIFCTVTSELDEIISSQADAELNWLLPQGSLVQKGQIVAKQDDYYLGQRVKVLQLELEKSQVDSDFFEGEYERLVSVSEKHRSVRQFEEARRQFEKSILNKKILQKQLEETIYRYEQLIHYAPVTGEIDVLHASLGEYLTIGEPIIHIIPAENKKFKCSVPMDLYLRSERFSNSRFMLEDQRVLQVVRSSLKLAEESQTLYIYLSADSPQDNEYLNGQRVKVLMSIAKDGVLEIPFDSLNIDNKQYYVWKLFENNTVEKVDVELLSTMKASAVVKSTLTVKDRVIVKGKKNLTGGRKVTNSALEIKK